MLSIPISSLDSRWSDADGDPVQFVGANTNSANGLNNVSSDGAYVYYTAAALPDTIAYTIADVRSNAPAVYRPGDTVRTATAEIRIYSFPAITAASINGNNFV